MDKLILVDGHNMLFRIFFGFNRPVLTSDGKDMRCPVGFVSSINKLVNDMDPAKLLVVFDSITSTTKRLEIFPGYKQNRVDYTELSEEENPFNQLPYIYEALKHLNISFVEADGYEADDYIATLSKHYMNDYDVVIVSTDSDFNQLVCDQVSIFKPRGKKSEWMTVESVEEKLSVSPDQIIEYKSLTGDTADNIPGIKGIGPKRAADILSYGTIDEIIQGQTEIPDKYRDKVLEHQEMLSINKALIAMIEDVPLEIDMAELDISLDSFFKPKSILEIF